MKKIIAVVVVLVLVVAGALMWKRHGDAPSSAPAIATSGSQSRASTADRRALDHVPEWALQANAPERKIAGHVVTAGAPVAGARVRIGLQIGEDLVQPVAEVMSAADGSFDFGTRPAAQFTVTAQADNHASASIAVSAADPHAKTDQLVLLLGDCRSRMSGTVSDASGGPILKAHLSIDLASADSDAGGHYAICLAPREGLDVPTAFVRLEADGYGTTIERVVVTG